MTWIVKANQSYPYLAAPGEGSAWGPDQSDAYRFRSRAKAVRAAAQATKDGPKDFPARVVRLRTVRERLKALFDATKVLVDFGHAGRPAPTTAGQRVEASLECYVDEIRAVYIALENAERHVQPSSAPVNAGSQRTSEKK